MAESWSPWHDRGLIDGHRIFRVIGNDGMAGLMVGGDGLILLVDMNAPPLRAWYERETMKRLELIQTFFYFASIHVLSLTFFLSPNQSGSR